MARILALETSGRTGSVALADDDHLLAERSFEYGLQNAARILPLIDELCRSHGWTPRAIDRIAVSIGPGSFTGLRIGVTMAKTLAFATGATVVPIPSVQVLAANAPDEANEVVVVLDAKRGQIFSARLRRASERWNIVSGPALVDPAAAIAEAGRPVYLIGDGIPYHKSVIDPLVAQDARIVVTEESMWIGRAGTVARLAIDDQFTPIDADKLVPLYIRKPEAEEKADARDAGK